MQNSELFFFFLQTKCKMCWLDLIGDPMSESLLLKVRLSKQWSGTRSGFIWATFDECFARLFWFNLSTLTFVADKTSSKSLSVTTNLREKFHRSHET